MEILRNLARRKLRSGLTISGIVIGIFALTTMGAMAEHMNALLAGGETYFGSSISVHGDGQGQSLLPMTKVAEVAQVPGVTAASPSYGFNAKPGDQGGISFGPGDLILSWDPNLSHSAFNLNFTQGHAPTARGEVAMGSDIAREFNKKVGDTIDLPVRPVNAKPDFQSHTFTVVGLLSKTRTMPDTVAWITVPDAQMLLKDSLPAAIRDTVDTSQLTDSITAYGATGASLATLDQIAQRITDTVPGVQADKPSQTVGQFKSASTIFTAITTGAAVLALIVGGLSVINTMLMAVGERVREIGLKKAVGARTRHVLREFVTEAALIGAIGGALGYGLGVALTTALNALMGASNPNQELFLVTPTLTVLAIGFAVAMGTVAGIIPAWRAARLDPVTALRAQ
jgi:putative ABC transport system permease protein